MKSLLALVGVSAFVAEGARVGSSGKQVERLRAEIVARRIRVPSRLS